MTYLTKLAMLAAAAGYEMSYGDYKLKGNTTYDRENGTVYGNYSMAGPGGDVVYSANYSAYDRPNEKEPFESGSIH